MLVNVNTGLADGLVFTNTASVTSTEVQTPEVSLPVTNTIGYPILGIAKQNNPSDSLIVGDTLTYTIIVSNTGPVDATGGVISDTLPSGVNLVSVVLEPASSGITSTTPPALATGLTITAGERITLSVVVTVSGPLADGDILSNTASVTGTKVITPEVSPPVTNTVVISPPTLSKSSISNVSPDGQATIGETIHLHPALYHSGWVYHLQSSFG